MVSLIIPCNEDRGYLQEAIESVENQTYKDIELILIKENNSLSANLNKGIKQAKGKYICFLSDDDKLTPSSVEDRVNFIGDYDFIHARARYFGLENKPYGLTNPHTTFYSCLETNGIFGASTLYKSEVLKNNLFDESLWTAEEWELHLRLLSKGYLLGFLDKFVYLYRRHSEQKSIGNQSYEYQKKRQKVKDDIRNFYTSISPSTPER